ncbi:hypothetical protein RCIP0075_00006 [Klebsiella phage RCIP0075]
MFTGTGEPRHDDYGVPIPQEKERAYFWADVRTASGVGAIRDGLSSGVPLSTARYSLKVQLGVLRHVTVGDTIEVGINGRDLAGWTCRLEGVIPDFNDRKYGYLLVTHDGTKPT